MVGLCPLQNMFFRLMLWVLYSDTVLAASLPQRSESISSLAAGAIFSSKSLSPANIPAPLNDNSSSGNKLQIACDARKYGKNLKVNSCRNVFNFLKKDDLQFRFSERDSGVPSDVPLPLRTLSSKKPHIYFYFLDTTPHYSVCRYYPSHSNMWTTGDGLCFVQPVLKQDAIFGHASPSEIGQAACTMLQTCVIERGMGGMAMNIGECS